MLCMDGGGAKGVIEATILDKIFITVAATLEVYNCLIMVLHNFDVILNYDQNLNVATCYLVTKIINKPFSVSGSCSELGDNSD